MHSFQGLKYLSSVKVQKESADFSRICNAQTKKKKQKTKNCLSTEEEDSLETGL
jgi:hypothetical protein